MGLAPSGQHENTANLLYAEVPVPIYSHRRRADRIVLVSFSDALCRAFAGTLGLNSSVFRRT
jgi:hypothetical protein